MIPIKLQQLQNFRKMQHILLTCHGTDGGTDFGKTLGIQVSKSSLKFLSIHIRFTFLFLKIFEAIKKIFKRSVLAYIWYENLINML